MFQRKYRSVKEVGTERTITDFPFDANVHGFQIDIDTDVSSAYSLDTAYARLEQALQANEQAMLREAIRKHLTCGEVTIQSPVTITLIQCGTQQGIFKIACTTDRGDVALVAAMSRAEVMNDFVLHDHETLCMMRSTEATALKMDEAGEAYASVASFPVHYVASENEESRPFFHIAPFMEGYAEVNSEAEAAEDCGIEDVDRRIIMNGYNQGTHIEIETKLESTRIRNKIAMHMLMTAIRCKMVFCPSLQAGDYIYSKEKDHLVLHCFGPNKGRENVFFGDVMRDVTVELSDGKTMDQATQALAFELLTLLFWEEENNEHVQGSLNGVKYFALSSMDLFDLIRSICTDHSDVISKTTMEEALVVVNECVREVKNTMDKDSEVGRAMSQRLAIVNLAFRTCRQTG